MNLQRVEPKPGQESVWDYPRPPRLESCEKRIRVFVGGETIADSVATKRVLETSHPPVYYIPPEDVDVARMLIESASSYCEWKGTAQYFSVVGDRGTVEKAAWSYSAPTARFATIRGYFAFYPSKMESCFVDDEQVQAQPGDFYGGWITSNIVGPFKGGPGTFGW